MSFSSELSAVTSLVNGFQTTCLLWAMLDLGLVERLEQGAASTSRLAEDLHLHADSLQRLLRALGALGLVEGSPAGWQLAARGRLLSRQGWGAGLRAWAELVGEEYLAAWSQLPQAVRGGQPTFPEVFGLSAWEHRARHPHLQDAFARLTEGEQKRTAALLLRQVAWQGEERVVDLGGGQGHVLEGLLRAHPGLGGCLFDLPVAVAGAAERLRDLAPRLTIAEGSFFEAPLPPGDVYLLKHVLHNWSDARAEQLLQRLASVMSPSARLLVLETLLDETDNPPAAPLLMDLHMLVIQGGQERTLGQYRELFERAGLELRRHLPGRGGRPDLLEVGRP